MTEMQKQFEEWRLSIVANSNLKKNGEIYFDSDVHCDWQAWQASRAAVVVKLPDTHNDWLDKQVVQYAIEAEGLSYE